MARLAQVLWRASQRVLDEQHARHGAERGRRPFRPAAPRPGFRAAGCRGVFRGPNKEAINIAKTSNMYAVCVTMGRKRTERADQAAGRSQAGEGSAWRRGPHRPPWCQQIREPGPCRLIRSSSVTQRVSPGRAIPWPRRGSASAPRSADHSYPSRPRPDRTRRGPFPSR